MGKSFNIAGLCIPHMHYMVDISDRIAEISKMVDRGECFVINRPRQYGKTTTLNALANALRDKYLVIKTSFEAVSDSLFLSEENFCGEILNRFADSVEFLDEEFAGLLRKYQSKSKDYDSLSIAIRKLIMETKRDIVLLIDEVDKSSNSRTFLKFLGLLRNKYLARNAGEDITFKSVILAGVHDIKNLKLAIRDENEARFNSPWNIAVKFNIDMSFSSNDIEKMLIQYKTDNNLDFDTKLIADEIHRLTNGYPYLVSDLCLIIDQDLERYWTVNGVIEASKQILYEKNTLFDDLIKNVENNADIKDTVTGMLFEGKSVSYNPDAYEKGLLYGIYTKKGGRLGIDNSLFEERLYNYLLEQRNIKELANPLTSIDRNRFIENGNLDMEKVVLKFREFMFQEYRHQDDKFYETYGRLLFLAYLKPIINGKGFSMVEPQTRENKRMDIVVIYGDDKFIIELKIWYGQEYEQRGLEQLCEYLDIQNVDKGWLITFGLNKVKEQNPEWIEINNKKIFKVIV